MLYCFCLCPWRRKERLPLSATSLSSLPTAHYLSSSPRLCGLCDLRALCVKSDVVLQSSPNSLRLNPFADPHPINPVASILYKNIGGQGVPSTLPPLSHISHLPYTLPSSVSCKSFVCHSCVNCRVSPYNSHSGTHPPVAYPPFFSIASVESILQPFCFDGLPSNRGGWGCHC